MKKFLAVLLIAIVACETVEEFNLKNWIDAIVETLKSLGIYDLLVTYGKQYAINFCSNYFGKSICETAINYLCSLIGM